LTALEAKRSPEHEELQAQIADRGTAGAARCHSPLTPEMHAAENQLRRATRRNAVNAGEIEIMIYCQQH